MSRLVLQTHSKTPQMAAWVSIITSILKPLPRLRFCEESFPISKSKIEGTKINRIGPQNDEEDVIFS